MKKNTVLFIHTPIASPAMPCWDSAMMAGSLSGIHLDCQQYDANLDFFLNYVLKKDKVEESLKKIEKERASGMISKTDFRLIENVCQRIKKSTVTIADMRTLAFYDPEKLLAIKRHMDDLFLCFSYAHFPYQVGWGPYAIMPDTLEETMNPFLQLCNESLFKEITKTHPDMVVLLVAGSEQKIAGKTMAGFIKENFPQTIVVGITPPHLVCEDTPVFDHQFSMDVLSPFFELVHGLYKAGKTVDMEWPDFKSLPLMDYLAPEIVLPVQSSFFKNMKSFQAFLSNQQDRLGVRGIVLKDDLLDREKSIEVENPKLFFSITKSMDDTNHPGSSPEGDPYPSGLKMICWNSPQEDSDLKVKALWDMSKQGAWNHVYISGATRLKLKNELFSFVAANPNIAHSFENDDGTGRFNQDFKNRIEPRFLSYDKVEPLQGQPFWKILADPVYILLYLNRYGKKNFFCMRADQKKGSVIRLGSDIRFFFIRPHDLPSGFLDEICRMVEAGGSVDIKYVRYNLKRAHLIGYAMENGMIVGNSSLKHPRQEFIKRVNKITDMDFTHFLERGYTSVRPEYRALGVGARLLKGLTERVGGHKIFSVISEDNKATQTIALRNKTKKIATYYSEKVGKELGVWMPEKMIETDRNGKK